MRKYGKTYAKQTTFNFVPFDLNVPTHVFIKILASKQAKKQASKQAYKQASKQAILFVYAGYAVLGDV